MVPLMRKAGGGRILNIASVNGLKGSRDSLSYSTAKGGIVNLTRCLASELSVDNITVNAIAPGFISTRMSILPDGTVEHESDWFNYIYVKHRRIPLAPRRSSRGCRGAGLLLLLRRQPLRHRPDPPRRRRHDRNALNEKGGTPQRPPLCRENPAAGAAGTVP